MIKKLLLTTILLASLFTLNITLRANKADAVSCTPVTIPAGEIIPSNFYTSEPTCMAGQCAAAGQSVDATGYPCCSGLTVGPDGTTCINPTSTKACYTSWRADIGSSGGCYSTTVNTTVACSSTEFPFTTCSINNGTDDLLTCGSICTSPTCNCPALCSKSTTTAGSNCGTELLPILTNCDAKCGNSNGCSCQTNCQKSATSFDSTCGGLKSTSGTGGSYGYRKAANNTCVQCFANDSEAVLQTCTYSDSSCGNTIVSSYCGLTATQWRQLNQSCVNGIDCANQRCLPSTGTTNGSLNLGNGSRCQYSSQCASGICSTSGVCVTTLEPGETSKPTGDPNATYQPGGEVIYTGYGSDVTLKDPNNTNTSGACTDNYDCALGYHCGGGTCQKDTYGCTSNTQCPLDYTCNGGTCQANQTKTGEDRDTGGTGGTGGTGTGQCQIADGKCSADCNCCSTSSSECIVVHKCDPNQGADVICVNLTPEIRAGGQCVDAQALANQTCSCVQVDILNGTNNSCNTGHYNGGDPYAISEGATVACPTDTTNCTTTINPPPPGQTPPPQSPQPGPQCLNITISENQPQLGQQVTFTCGEVAGAARYVFRIQYPGGATDVLQATGRVSQPITVSQAGTYRAQCQICTGTDDASCHPFEYLPQQ